MSILIPKYTEEFRQQELARGEASLFYFGYSILGFTSVSEQSDIHRDLTSFLEGRAPHHPWNRALICAFRGSAKSTWATIVYPLWRGAYKINFATKIIENSSQNAKTNHFMPIVELFTRSSRSDYLCWLLESRIPPGWEGTNSEQFSFIRTDPLAKPTITFAGIESKGEGYHGNCVILDDPEGADAEKSNVGNEEAHRAYERSTPLLIDPHLGQILAVCTPHGSKPLAYRLRRQYGWKTEADNATCPLKVWWRPILDAEGKSRWPERFPDSIISTLKMGSSWNTQYMLREHSQSDTLFDMEAVRNAFYDWEDPLTKKAIRYPAFEWDPDAVSEEGYVKPRAREAVVGIRELRFFLHYDPLHRTLQTRRSPTSKQRPAKAAITAVGVAPDLHVFLLDYWCEDRDDIGAQVDRLFKFYLKWEPYKVTWEVIGAQAWLMDIIKGMKEKSHPEWSRPLSLGHITGTRLPLPRLSARLHEASKAIESKEDVHREILSPWVNYGVLHLRRDQEEPMFQLENAQNEDCAVDILDCLAQGPEVWSAPAGDIAGREFMRRRFVASFVQKTRGLLAGGRRWG